MPQISRSVKCIIALCLPKSDRPLRWLAKQLTPVSEAFSASAQSSCGALNGDLRRELKGAVELDMSSDLVLAAHNQLVIDFRVLRDDRILAQQIMETQLAEINQLKEALCKQ